MKKDRIGGIIRQKKKDGKDFAICRVTVNGKTQTVYLGVWGESVVDDNYKRVAAKFYSGAFVCVVNKPRLSDLYSVYIDELNTKPKCSETEAIRAVIEYSMEVLDDCLLENISVDTLATFQSYLVSIANTKRKRQIDDDGCVIVREKGVWSRQYINKLFNLWKRVIKFGILKGIVPYQFMGILSAFPAVKVNPLLNERERREGVSDETVIKTLPFLTPTVADMIKVIRSACLRPGECCRLKVGDISFDGDIAYCGSVHNKVRGRNRFIAFDKATTEILKRRCNGKKADDYVFTPEESEAERRDEQRKNRKSKVYRYARERDEKNESTRFDRMNECWDSQALSRSVQYAIDRANRSGVKIGHWTPYQLRHAAYTANSLEYGAEIASKIAGHTSPNMARVYDHSAAMVSIEKAKQRKCWWK